MSTYNGERFLPEQLRSIYDQQGVQVSLLVRDDGSTDGTLSLLSQEQSRGALRFYTGPNLRPARSFMHLLRQAPDEADLYAFSDQDDVWLPDKLLSAALAIGQERGPALYFCQTSLVDERLSPLPQVLISPRLTYGEALVYQFVGGCTMVFNSALRDIVNQYEPSYLRMHDIWVYDIALAVGARVCFDPIPHILYRQHQRNAVGQSASLGREWTERMSRLLHPEHIRLRTARELLQGYASQMSLANRSLTEAVVASHGSLRQRLSLAFSRKLSPASSTIAITSRVALLLGIF